jgi:hypothetical protein
MNLGLSLELNKNLPDLEHIARTEVKDIIIHNPPMNVGIYYWGRLFFDFGWECSNNSFEVYRQNSVYSYSA